ncbi:hypothetical protein KXD40_003649 [Peronospora effusa]|uniref:Uncharacterized protein n=1 Tax=Peronospora effusa TaxID=542832 RepID=A0A3M6VJH7_9STRA|nr:hypothetical protein DD238_003755 [Peronospora effusa]RQM15965.1 hypothetical protein DD237_004241 [Peronospora effusa]UIZ22851.1 hypothetical protein KXD40_003649 [Peronospora effusa]CAI5700598.1 unnamed protein product [Peronospora effusa]
MKMLHHNRFHPGVPAPNPSPIKALRNKLGDENIMKSVDIDGTIGNALVENWLKEKTHLDCIKDLEGTINGEKDEKAKKK